MEKEDLNKMLSMAKGFQYESIECSESIKALFEEKMKNKDSSYEDVECSESVKSFFKEKMSLNEEQFDDFETVYEQLKFAIDLELKNFALNLMNNYASNFMWTFAKPSSEVFQQALERAVNKYTVSDHASQEQFINRIKLVFQKIFIEQYGLKDEKQALSMADKYTEIFKKGVSNVVDQVKKQADKGGTTVPVAQEPDQKRTVDYR